MGKLATENPLLCRPPVWLEKDPFQTELFSGKVICYDGENSASKAPEIFPI